MKLLLGTILLAAVIILGVCTIKTFKEQHKHASVVRRILLLGLIIVFVNIISLFTEQRWLCMYAYSVYFIASDWMLYYLFKFSLEYIGNRFENHVKKEVMIALLLADSLSIALNNIYEHLYSLNHVSLFDGESYYELVITPFYYIHYAIILMLVTFSLISLFYGAIKAPVFYRRKYFVIGIILAILVVLNFITFKSAIDVSIIGYVVEGICIYYCAFVFSPQKLLPKTLFEVAQDMSIGLYVLDIEGADLYSNLLADELLAHEPPLVSKSGSTLGEWCQERYLHTDEDFMKEVSFFCDDKEYILKIQLQRMKDGNEQLQGGYFTIQDRTNEVANLRQEKYLATHDSLTDFLNRAAFYKNVEDHLHWHPATKMLLICTDIKDFKMINDFFGTQAGDIILKNYAKMLRRHIRGAYSYGRLVNDVFAVLIPKEIFEEEMFPPRDANSLFDGIEKDISFPIIDYIGIYEVTDRTLPASVMCDRARMAISSIKGDLHKRIIHYDYHLRDNILHEQELINDLKDAIATGQLKMFLQPQMSSSGKLLGAEALVRWVHPIKGAIMPGDFIPIFEQNGLISDVDLYIWELACKQLRKWKDEGRDDLHISVNISPKDFYFLNIYQTFTELVNKYDLNPRNLKLEITETAVVMDFQRQMDLINRLRKTGFVVEMDDFGSGYSSLNMLKDIYVDILKIDMAFLKKAQDEERSKKILQMIITLSNNLGMPVITEGVETAEQVAFLTEMGCQMFQGYYFSKPVDVETFEARYFSK